MTREHAVQMLRDAYRKESAEDIFPVRQGVLD